MQPPQEWLFLGFDDSIPDFPQKQWLETFAGERRIVMRSNDLLLLFQGACEGWGITVLPHFLVQTGDRIAAIPDAPQFPSRPLCLVMHLDIRRSPRVRAVADLLVDIFQQNTEGLSG